LQRILKLGPGYRDLLRHIELKFLSEDGLSLLEEDLVIPPESLWQCAAERIVHSLHSQIISGFPEIFAEFRGKGFSLLWRGSRDGFEGREFHGRCDGHANTLTLILDTEGNIFGGFTPVEWESRVWKKANLDDLVKKKRRDVDHTWKVDDSQKSFLFTLKNPHNIPAMRFALKAEKGHVYDAICCDSKSGPGFGFQDICVCSDRNGNPGGSTLLGLSYTNGTGLNGEVVFTGSWNFQVDEIEVFEITG
jgi:hypothetical protein